MPGPFISRGSNVKAAIFQEAHKPLTIEDLEVRDPGPGEVLVRTVCSGVCHSDMHFLDGSWALPLPTVLGHEAAGVVERVGEGVSYVEAGDHVIMSFKPFCGACYYCLRGAPQLCSDQSLNASMAARLTWKGGIFGAQQRGVGNFALRRPREPQAL